MNKARGCFIAFIVVFIIGLVIVLLVIIPSIKNPSTSASSDVAVTDSERSNTSSKEQPGNSLGLGSKNFLFLGVDEREGRKKF